MYSMVVSTNGTIVRTTMAPPRIDVVGTGGSVPCQPTIRAQKA